MTIINKHNQVCCILLLLGGAVLLVSGLWIPVKAKLAQILLRRAWQETLHGNAVKPWAWADMQTIGRLHVHRLGIDEIILEGSHGETLAFGPGHEPKSAPPGSGGHTILYGHRDTSFAFLQKLEIGDTITLEGKTGAINYRISNMEVADSSHLFLPQDADGFLTLITCYPFVQVVPNNRLRYVITAVRIES